MTPRPFRQVDVFTTAPCRGNPVAVVHGAEGLTGEQMQAFAAWMNLSESTFLLPPQDERADYRVRIFTPSTELPFAGHPTLGTCHAWLEAGGQPSQAGVIVQQCGAGLVPVRHTADGLAFAAPPVRPGPVEEPVLREIVSVLGLARDEIVDAQWVDNGPHWVAVLLESAEAALAVKPAGDTELYLGVVGPYPPSSPEAFEVRAFFPKDGRMAEDPVTGSLNAGLAQWLLDSGRVTAPYVASQGTALGRRGRVHVDRDEAGALWIAGGTVTIISGTAEL
jgi:PhzF family phenazine biosynthesis protein